MKTQPIISLHDASVQIDGKNLLKNLSLQISNGELVTIVGPNGAGKSPLMKILTRIQPVTSGRIEVLGRPVTAALKRRDIRDLRSQIGQVFQGLHSVPRLTVLENVLIGRLSLNRSFKTWARIFSEEDYRVANAAMDRVGISHKAKTRVDRLSGGERQKVAIARALAQETRLLLADEPTSNLDPKASLEIAQLLRDLIQEKTITIVTVIHDLALLPVLGGRVIGLRDGQLQFDQLISQSNLKEFERN